MNNEQRKSVIEAFADLYCPAQQFLLERYLPTQEEDQDGSEFEKYFTLIQGLFAAKTDPGIDLSQLQLLNDHFKFPPQQINALTAVKDE